MACSGQPSMLTGWICSSRKCVQPYHARLFTGSNGTWAMVVNCHQPGLRRMVLATPSSAWLAVYLSMPLALVVVHGEPRSVEICHQHELHRIHGLTRHAGLVEELALAGVVLV